MVNVWCHLLLKYIAKGNNFYYLYLLSINKPELKDVSNIVLNSSESRSNGRAIVVVWSDRLPLFTFAKTTSICISLIYIRLRVILIRIRITEWQIEDALSRDAGICFFRVIGVTLWFSQTKFVFALLWISLLWISVRVIWWYTVYINIYIYIYT